LRGSRPAQFNEFIQRAGTHFDLHSARVLQMATRAPLARQRRSHLSTIALLFRSLRTRTSQVGERRDGEHYNANQEGGRRHQHGGGVRQRDQDHQDAEEDEDRCGAENGFPRRSAHNVLEWHAPEELCPHWARAGPPGAAGWSAGARSIEFLPGRDEAASMASRRSSGAKWIPWTLADDAVSTVREKPTNRLGRIAIPRTRARAPPLRSPPAAS